MNSFSDQDLIKSFEKYADFLKSDKSWKWQLDEDKFLDYFHTYQENKPFGAKNLDYLGCLMGYGGPMSQIEALALKQKLLDKYKEDPSKNIKAKRDAERIRKIGNIWWNLASSTRVFSRIRNKKKKASGWSIFRLAHELNYNGKVNCQPSTFAKPCGSESKRAKSKEQMKLAWDLGAKSNPIKDYINSSTPEKYGVTLTTEEIINSLIAVQREKLLQSIKTVVQTLVAPLILWLKEKSSNAATVGGVVLAAVAVSAIVIAVMPQQCSDSIVENDTSSSDLDNGETENSRNESDLNDRHTGTPVSSDDSNTYSSDYSENHADKKMEESYSDSLRPMLIVDGDSLTRASLLQEANIAAEKGPSTADLDVGVNIIEGGFTVTSYALNTSGMPMHQFTRAATQCEVPSAGENYYTCYLVAIPSGAYEVEFNEVDGYITPASRQVQLTARTGTIYGDYAEIIRMNGTIHAGVNLLQGGFALTSDEDDSNGDPVFSWTRTGADCNIPDANGYSICNFLGLNLGGYTITYLPVSGYTTPASQGILLTETATEKTALGSYTR